MSAHLALGAVGVLAGLAALGRRGSRDRELVNMAALEVLAADIDAIPGQGPAPTKVFIEADTGGLKIELKQAGRVLGYFRVSTMGTSSWQLDLMPMDCRAAWEDLGRPTLWLVRGVTWYDHALRRRGLGRRIYEVLADYVTRHGGWLAPGRCDGSGTTADAQRVWQSLRRTHRVIGPFLRSGSGSRGVTLQQLPPDFYGCHDEDAVETGADLVLSVRSAEYTLRELVIDMLGEEAQLDEDAVEVVLEWADLDNDDAVMMLGYFAIPQSVRFRGLGTEGVKRLERWARKRGLKAIMLFSAAAPGAAHSHPFWERMGYDPLPLPGVTYDEDQLMIKPAHRFAR